MTTRVLVLGAGGFIGRRITAGLLASGRHTPVAAVRRLHAEVPPGVEALQLDATCAKALRRQLDDVDAVVNAVTGNAETIVAGARALFAAARERPALQVVHLSTMSVYGSASGLVDESAPRLGDLDPYSAAKAEAERLADRCPNVIHLRPGIVYGPRSPLWSGLIGRLLLDRRLGDLGPAGRGICNLVHVEDVAAAALAALAHPELGGRAFNLGLPDAPTWNGYFAHYAEALDAAPVVAISPSRLQWELKAFGPLRKIGEMIAERTGLPPPSPPLRPWLTTLCRHELRLRVADAEHHLGLQWRPLGLGLRETADWVLGGLPAADRRHKG